MGRQNGALRAAVWKRHAEHEINEEMVAIKKLHDMVIISFLQRCDGWIYYIHIRHMMKTFAESIEVILHREDSELRGSGPCRKAVKKIEK